MAESTTMLCLSTATDSESSSHVGLLGGQLCAPPAVVTGRDNGHLTCRMCTLITGLLLKTERVGDAAATAVGGGVGVKAAGWLGRKQHYVTRHPQSTLPPAPSSHRPYFTASNWTGQPPLAARPPLGLPCLF